MIIRTGTATVRVDSLERAIAQVERLARQVGGYVANSTLQSGSETARQALFDVLAHGVDIPAGTTVVMMIGAANRDPSRFDNPEEFRADRPNAREQIAFGRDGGDPGDAVEASEACGRCPRPRSHHQPARL